MPRIHLPSEVTGTVWKVEVSAGDPVSADQTLVILESMKMETAVVAHRSGVLAQVASVGAVLAADAPLARIA